MAPETSNALHTQPPQTGCLRKTRTQNLPFHVQATFKPGGEKARSEGDLNTSRPLQLTVTEHTGPETPQPCSLPKLGLLVTQIHAFPVPALPSTLVTISTAHPFLQPQVSVNLCQEQEESKLNQSRPRPAPIATRLAGSRGSRTAESLLQGEHLSAPCPPERTCRLSARTPRGRQARPSGAQSIVDSYAVLPETTPLPLGRGGRQTPSCPLSCRHGYSRTPTEQTPQALKTLSMSGRKPQLRGEQQRPSQEEGGHFHTAAPPGPRVAQDCE